MERIGERLAKALGWLRALGWRRQLGIAFLAAQLAGVAYARFVPTRYFAWAPNDYAVDYAISATVDGRALSPAQIRQRYRFPARGLYEFPPRHLIDDLAGVERLYHSDQRVLLRLRYRLDGHAVHVWRYRS